MPWLALLGTPTRLITLVGVGLFTFFAWGSIQSVVDRYTNLSGEVEKLSHQNKLLTSRLEAYNLRISRRDEAINASKCKEKIQYWLKHPDEIPKPFDPFNLNR